MEPRLPLDNCMSYPSFQVNKDDAGVGVPMPRQPREKQPGVSTSSSPTDRIISWKRSAKNRGAVRRYPCALVGGSGTLPRAAESEEKGWAGGRGPSRGMGTKQGEVRSLSIPSEQLSHLRQMAEGRNYGQEEASVLSLPSRHFSGQLRDSITSQTKNRMRCPC